MTTRDLIVDAALVLAAMSGAVGVLGAVQWHRGRHSRAFWISLRVVQVAAIVYALAAGIAYAAGAHPSDNLFYLYALLPLAVSFVAEQLRILSAEQVLTNQGLETAQEVGELPAEEQRSIVLAIMRRETGIMAIAALVICFLALRAAGTY